MDDNENVETKPQVRWYTREDVLERFCFDPAWRVYEGKFRTKLTFFGDHATRVWLADDIELHAAQSE